MLKSEKMAEMANIIESGTLLEHLEEVGHIRLDHLTDHEVQNLDLLIETLEEHYNIPARDHQRHHNKPRRSTAASSTNHQPRAKARATRARP